MFLFFFPASTDPTPSSYAYDNSMYMRDAPDGDEEDDEENYASYDMNGALNGYANGQAHSKDDLVTQL